MFSRLFTHRTFSAAATGAGKSVGFVGLGCMGLPMATNLRTNGYTVKGYDIMPDARKAAADSGL